MGREIRGSNAGRAAPATENRRYGALTSAAPLDRDISFDHVTAPEQGYCSLASKIEAPLSRGGGGEGGLAQILRRVVGGAVFITLFAAAVSTLYGGMASSESGVRGAGAGYSEMKAEVSANIVFVRAYVCFWVFFDLQLRAKVVFVGLDTGPVHTGSPTWYVCSCRVLVRLGRHQCRQYFVCSRKSTIPRKINAMFCSSEAKSRYKKPPAGPVPHAGAARQYPTLEVFGFSQENLDCKMFVDNVCSRPLFRPPPTYLCRYESDSGLQCPTSTTTVPPTAID